MTNAIPADLLNTIVLSLGADGFIWKGSKIGGEYFEKPGEYAIVARAFRATILDLRTGIATECPTRKLAE